MPVSSGMSIRMFPLTPGGDWTAAVSEYWGVSGGRNEWIEFSRLQTGCFQVKAIGKSRRALAARTFFACLR